MNKHEIISHLPVTTERLILRVPTAGDIDLIQAAKEARVEDLRRWMSWSSPEGLSRAGTEFFIGTATDMHHPSIPLIATDKANGAFVFSSGIDALTPDFTKVSTGWWVNKDFEGQGLVYEGMTGLIRFAFNTLGVQEIQSEYYEGNARSQNLMERLGFQFVGINPLAHQSHLTGDWAHVYKYVLTPI